MWRKPLTRQELWTSQLNATTSYKQNSSAKTNFQIICYHESNFHCSSQANPSVWDYEHQRISISVMVFQNSYHNFYITSKFSIYQKHHNNFPMFIATYIQDLWQTGIYSNGIYFDEWWQDTRNTRQIISLVRGSTNISKLSIFNLLFSST